MSLKSQIESLLFVVAKPLPVKQLAELVKEPEADVERIADELEREYRETSRGMQIVKSGNKYQMVSSPENAEVVRGLVKDETSGELSRPSLETLTIIAYRGPIAKSALDRIRGVNCSLILRNLLIRGLVEAKSEKDNDEAYYTVTLDFLRHLGINAAKELPDFERLSNEEIADTEI